MDTGSRFPGFYRRIRQEHRFFVEYAQGRVVFVQMGQKQSCSGGGIPARQCVRGMDGFEGETDSSARFARSE